jgi:serine/threonine protein kinase
MGSASPKPTRIGAYDVVDVIGRGGMGTVFKAVDPRIGRSVAIKVLTAAADDPDLLLRFYREAKYTGSLQHQNIVTVYELGHQDGVPYLVMEYLEGVSLDAIIASGRPMPMGEKLRIILQVCSGLSYAHKRDLVHRDIKPANIMIVESGTAKIVDFGIARLGGNRLTRTGHVVGSLNYMSPEQLSGNTEVDLRTDVYSTGVVLFQLVTGVLPFEGSTTAATLTKIMQDPPPPVARYVKECPADLEAIVQKALAKKREERYASADELAVDVARLQQHYEGQMLADYLRQASESMRGKDFTSARQQVLKVLRVAPQNTEASELLRVIKQRQEQQQREEQQQKREQQLLQLQMKAEEAFRKNEFKSALQFVEQGLQMDPNQSAFLGLRNAIVDAQSRMTRYREALQRSEGALRAGDLEAAKRAIDDAIEILPDDPECKALASQIAARIEQHLREQRAALAQRQIALAVNVVEKALADARMLVFLGQASEALDTLNKVENDLAQIPPHYREQVETQKAEAHAKIEQYKVEQARLEQARLEQARLEQARLQEEQHHPEWSDIHSHPTGEMPALNATVLMQSGPAPPETEPRFTDLRHEDRPIQHDELLPPTPQFSEAPSGPYTVAPLRPPVHEEKPAVAPELLEFLQPEPKPWSRPVIWVGVAVAILVVACVWLLIRPGQNSSRLPKPNADRIGAATNYSYAEINAEPWGTITAVDPASGDAQKAVGSQTPLRVKLPAGQYNITIEGPNHEQKQVEITVPPQGGTSCFVFFRKPNLNQILSQK